MSPPARPTSASSSRRCAVKGLFALALSPACSRQKGGEVAPSPGPLLLAEPPLAEGAKAEGLSPRDRDALWLLLGSLLPEGRRALLDDVAAQLTAIEAKKNPLLVNLLDEPPPASFFASRPWLAPALNAARALTCARFRVPGGPRLVRALSADEGGEGALAAWGGGGGEAERLRFAAWPASFGLFLRFATAEDARRGGAALGGQLAREGTTLGAVLGGPGAARPPERPPFELSPRARRASGELIEIAQHLAEGPPPGPPCPWLSPRENEAYVVPRLGAIARRPAFVDEVRRALREGGSAAHYYDGQRGAFERA